jgi:hypothetical protein
MILSRHIKAGLAAAVLITGAAGSAHAEDFFSALFGGMNAPRAARAMEPLISIPFARDGADYAPSESRQARRYGGGQAYCVRSCDGRYFPINGSDNPSRAATCNSFCPASDTKVVYGGSIDNAATETGKPYSELPNAFKYREAVVPGCTCNGKDQFGLAKVEIGHDPTLRKGDIVAGGDGLMVAAQNADRRHGELKFSPASAALRARFQRAPVVASD